MAMIFWIWRIVVWVEAAGVARMYSTLAVVMVAPVAGVVVRA